MGVCKGGALLSCFSGGCGCWLGFVVQPPDWTKSFHVFVDASDIVIRSVLMQLTELKWYRLVYYASQKLSKAEPNYSTTEREALGMVYSVTKY